MRTAVAAAIVLTGLAGPAAAEVSGRGQALLGDVVEVSGQKFRLFGIDAPEFHQFCYDAGDRWNCGIAALRELQTLVDPERVTCTEKDLPPDPLGTWAVCTIGGRDLALDLVQKGMAVALRDQTMDYVEAEDAARAARTGVWRSRFLPPAVYRAEMQEIEDRLDLQLTGAAREAVEKVLTEGQGGIPVFDSFQIVRGGTGLPLREYAFNELAPGFLMRSVVSDVLDWREPAAQMASWRQVLALNATIFNANQMWAELATRPRVDVETVDGPTFLVAMKAAAGPIKAAGRRPILLVRASADPPWVGEWINGAPPEGVEVTIKEDLVSPYLGTVDGIDVFVAELPEDEAFVVPSDLLTEVRFATNADDQVVTMAEREVTEAMLAEAEIPLENRPTHQLVFTYGQQLTWKDDQITAIHYPYDPPDPYGEGAH